MLTNFQYLNWILSLVIIAMLLAAVFLGLRFLSWLPYSMKKAKHWFKVIANQNNNINILGVKYIDMKHKIVLLNYQNKTYLIMLGKERDLLLDIITNDLSIKVKEETDQ